MSSLVTAFSKFLTPAVAIACALGLLGAAGRASQRLLWADELYTYYVSQLPVAGIWHALADGIDPHPPLGYVTTKIALGFFGDGLVQARLAPLAGFALAVLGIGRFVGRRYGFAAGAVASLVPFVTAAYDYSFEARPYAMVLGLSAVALVCWQAAAGPARRRALVGLAVAIAGSVSSHYFGGLVVIAIVVGELVRGQAGDRRPGVWIAVAAGLAPLLALLPLLEASSGWSGAFWTRPSFAQWLYTYRLFLFPTVLPAAIVLAAGSVIALWNREAARSAPSELEMTDQARADLAVCVALFLSPTAAVAIAYVAGGYHARYSIVMVLGFAGLIGQFLGSARSIHLCRLSAIVLAMWVMARGIVAAAPLLSGGPLPDVFTIHPLLASPTLPPSLPIVVGDGAAYIQLEHYAPPALGRRLRAVLAPQDPPGASYSDTSKRGLEGLARWHPMAVVRYEDLLRRREPFLAYADASWLPHRLARDGARLELLGATFEDSLILVTPGP
jgi:dolichyl-phosphate-mannose-protein mannosyltransferase